MRLIDTQTLDLQEFDEDDAPKYAILSHTWEDGEVSYADMQHLDSAREKKGFTKIARAAELADEEDLRWMWVDTCCIDKSSSAELQEAINSMWRWYSNAALCYVFMSDLPNNMPYLTDEGAYQYSDNERAFQMDDSEYPAMIKPFTGAKWFTRGWCLQELIAPRLLLFYSFQPNGGKCKLIGNKSELLDTISNATNIACGILDHLSPLSNASVAQRMSWASKRQTRRIEDQAYSLLGIFEVSMPMLYGEGKRAFIRLQEEIMRTNSDHSLFAWSRWTEPPDGTLLATSPADFSDASGIEECGLNREPFRMTNRGLRITLPLMKSTIPGPPEYLAVLNCRYAGLTDITNLALRLVPVGWGKEQHVAVSNVLGSTGQRLAVVLTGDADSATPSEVLVPRTVVPASGNVSITLHLATSGPNRDSAYVRESYSEDGRFKNESPSYFVHHRSSAMAGVIFQYPCGRQMYLVFGFRRYPAHDMTGLLLPGVWAGVYDGSQRLEAIVKNQPTLSSGKAKASGDPRKAGWPYMPQSASVHVSQEEGTLHARIEHEQIFHQDYLMVIVKTGRELKSNTAGDSVAGPGPWPTVLSKNFGDPPMDYRRAIVPEPTQPAFAVRDGIPTADVIPMEGLLFASQATPQRAYRDFLLPSQLPHAPQQPHSSFQPGLLDARWRRFSNIKGT